MALIAFTCFLIPSHPQLRRTQRRLGLLFLALLAFTVILLTPWGVGLINALPLKEYQKNRILSAINPFADQYNTGYQLINGLVSFATGGWFGLGFGNSVRKYTNFPAANTDFILAIIVEELGIVGFLAVFIPYCIIIIQLFRYAQKIRSEKAKIILVGTAMKRRMRNDYEQQKKFALEDFAKQILPVVDNCERALAAESKDEAYRKGVEMIHSQLVAALASEGVTEMDLLGKPYDANNAQAVAKEKKEDAEPGTVIQVLQKGYTMKDRLLRAAMVKVSE